MEANKVIEEDEDCDLSTRDHWKARISWILIFSLFNAFLGYPIGEGWNILEYCLSSSNFYIDFLWSFVYLTMMMLWTIEVTAYFDKKQLWKDGFLNRLIAQLLFAFLPSMLFLEMADQLYTQVSARRLFRINQNISQFPFFFWVSLIYTLFYSLISLFAEYMNSVNRTGATMMDNLISSGAKIIDEERKVDSQNNDNSNPVITIREGKEIRLNDLDIVWVSNSNGMNIIYERNYDNPPVQDGHPLKFWVERLDSKDYYQISRWDLVHRDIIKGYTIKPDKNFKMELDYPGEHQLILNKDKMDDFAKWFSKEL
ncbi:hypothetical protein KO02_01550 [Sphingobacterium sp. ML3W]|uniref:hypothetical protein n=1 Tax=Sphingobacterium sp. ML3W TaxID=1538644 RepID=UPI0004F6E8A0|nr:hypothetical protein [Sphingobacterium sp. ML3W]AIM35489.1 hypothetical protein KO02_01550 [Sphingobacterium sp. ML3W]